MTDLAGSEGWPYSPPDRTFVYVTIGHEEDVTAALGLEGKGVGETLTRLEVIHFAAILDRVGGGDSFASGLIYGLLEGTDLQTAVDYGAAHGALAMSTPGDTSMATAAEVIKLARGGSARVDR